MLETIPKTKKSTKKKSEKKEYDLAKETVKFLRHIDYARLRDFDLKILMGYLIYNLRKKICRLFQVLAQFLFTTSETELDYITRK